MKALTLWQPWASLMAMGHKKVETRVWETKYREPIAIHAAMQLPPAWLGTSQENPEFKRLLEELLPGTGSLDSRVAMLPRGAVLCIVNLVSIENTENVRDSLAPK